MQNAEILIADDVQDECLKVLIKSGLEAELKPKISESELVQIIPNYTGLIVRSRIKVTKPIIEAGKNLKIIGRAGIGTDNIDVETATRKGIVVVNAPMSNITAAAEHTFALILSSARNITKADAAMRNGGWERHMFTGVELEGKTLGIIGLGKVGSLIVKYAASFSVHVVCYDPFISRERASDLGVELVSLDNLLQRADIITIHVPLTEATRGLISKGQLKQMKKRARLINTSRGGIVDESALAEALRNREIAGACLDVFEKEPLPQDSPLRTLDNCILTPHLGASTEEAQVKVATDIANEFIEFFTKGVTKYAVNLTTIQDPSLLPFIELAFCLGNILGQMTEGRTKSVEIGYEGNLAKASTQAITNSCVNGALRPVCEDVNIINARVYADDRKIQVIENRVSDGSGYKNLLRVTLTTDKMSWHSLAGTIFEDNEPRIVSIDGQSIDLRPSKYMLIMFYPDVPGVVGKFGSVLGKHGINIESMSVGRTKRGQRAAIVVTLDDPVPPVVTEEIKTAIEGIEEIKTICLKTK